jgi:hypothetical protein
MKKAGALGLVPRTQRSVPFFTAWCAAEPGPRLLYVTELNRGRGSAKQRFAKSYALHRARDT